MRWRPISGAAALMLMLTMILTACDSSPSPRARTEQEQKLFGAVSLKLDSFSKVKDWNNTGKPEGVEAFVEFADRFGDRTKAAGTILFELYAYRPGWPDPRGGRVGGPWSATLTSFDDQQAHWDRASGAYMFRLNDSDISPNVNYILTASFEPLAGDRMTAQILVKSQAPAEPTTRATDNPGASPSDPPTPRR